MEGLIINTSSDAIEQRQKIGQNTTQVQKFQFDEKNYLNTRLKTGEKEKKIKVRILPISATNGDIFMSINIHSLKVDKQISQSGFKTFVCLNDSNLKEHDERGCPLCNKSKELFNEANNMDDSNPSLKKEVIKSAFSFQSKVAYIVRVIERGKENEGVKFWRFNHRTDHLGVYDKLMTLYNQRRDEAKQNGRDGYSIFDLMNGRDIEIKLTYVDSTGKTTMDIIDSGFETPLSRDIEQANAWIQDTKTWRDIYALKNYDYLEIVAEGGVPIYDTAQNKWVEKVDNSTYDGKDKQSQLTPKQEESNMTVSTAQPHEIPQPILNSGASDGDDLPF